MRRVITESQLRQIVRRCIREMEGDYPEENYEWPEELNGIIADEDKAEDDYWREYFEDMEADNEISRLKSEFFDNYY